MQGGGIYFQERNGRAAGRNRSLSASVERTPFQSALATVHRCSSIPHREHTCPMVKKKKKSTNHASQITAILPIRNGRAWHLLVNTVTPQGQSAHKVGCFPGPLIFQVDRGHAGTPGLAVPTVIIAGHSGANVDPHFANLWSPAMASCGCGLWQQIRKKNRENLGRKQLPNTLS